MTKLEILKAARALIDEPWKWTRKTFARDKHGSSVAPLDSRAECFCVIGALCRVTQNPINKIHDDAVYLSAVGDLLLAAKVDSIPRWQDHQGTTHAQVLKVIDAAISAAALEEARAAECAALERAP